MMKKDVEEEQINEADLIGLGGGDELILKQKKRKNLTDNPYKFNK